MTKLTLLEVRCPYRRNSKATDTLYVCNSLCAKVAPGSAGEVRCRKCRQNFEFYADHRARVQTGVRVQPVPAINTEE